MDSSPRNHESGSPQPSNPRAPAIFPPPLDLATWLQGLGVEAEAEGRRAGLDGNELSASSRIARVARAPSKTRRRRTASPAGGPSLGSNLDRAPARSSRNPHILSRIRIPEPPRRAAGPAGGLPGQNPAGRRRPARSRSNVPCRLRSRPGLRPDNRRGQAALPSVEPRLYPPLVAGRARAQAARCSSSRRLTPQGIPLRPRFPHARIEPFDATVPTARDGHDSGHPRSHLGRTPPRLPTSATRPLPGWPGSQPPPACPILPHVWLCVCGRNRASVLA